jgi:hypothetical protein
MWVVTTHARDRRVHGDGGDCSLCIPMATRAVAWFERFERPDLEARAAALAVVGEGVAIHAAGVHRRAETLLCPARRMSDRRPGFMARRTAIGRDHAHARSAELVAGIARDPLFFDVHSMATDAPITAPSRLDVDAPARRATRALFARTPLRTAEQSDQNQQENSQARAVPNTILNGSLRTRHWWALLARRQCTVHAQPALASTRTDVAPEF